MQHSARIETWGRACRTSHNPLSRHDQFTTGAAPRCPPRDARPPKTIHRAPGTEAPRPHTAASLTPTRAQTQPKSRPRNPDCSRVPTPHRRHRHKTQTRPPHGGHRPPDQTSHAPRDVPPRSQCTSETEPSPHQSQHPRALPSPALQGCPHHAQAFPTAPDPRRRRGAIPEAWPFLRPDFHA